jgi:hypothetical protein
MLKVGSLGNVKSHTLRAFRRKEVETFWRRSVSGCYGLTRFESHIAVIT